MALTVEDGTGVAGADSFIELADARTLATNYGITLPDDDTAAEVSLRQGYRNLLTQEATLQGARTYDVQTGIYPRSGVLNNCKTVAGNSIPEEVKFAQLYAASAIADGYSQNTVGTGQNLKSFSVEGVYSETYQDGAKVNTNAIIQGVVNSLYPLTKSGLASSPCGGGSGGLYRDNMFPYSNGYKVI